MSIFTASAGRVAAAAVVAGRPVSGSTAWVADGDGLAEVATADADDAGAEETGGVDDEGAALECAFVQAAAMTNEPTTTPMTSGRVPNKR
ncbi:MAG TPA: hypothetical protein VN738_06350 [Acidothermaceae bacterium]|nr:hypothetical protein [Acidothermaceae bacterium]